MIDVALEALARPWPVAAAIGAEMLLGYPAWLHRRLPHPVTWVGAAIDALEDRWNRPDRGEGARRALGVACLLLVTGSAALAGWALQGLMSGVVGLIAFALVGSLGLAGRSLYVHITDVMRPLAAGDLPAARLAVARVVGRDTADLDEAGVAAAALESLAESFSDGVVAPAFWLLVGGLPGLFAYKAVNTADSMIGHMEPRWRSFGWAAARTDDLMNLIPARITGLLICAVAPKGWWVMWRDAGRHASPNAGWPEAAMAGALGRRLGGPAIYDGLTVERPTFGDGPAPLVADIRRGLSLYAAAGLLLCGGLLIGGLAWPR